MIMQITASNSRYHVTAVSRRAGHFGLGLVFEGSGLWKACLHMLPPDIPAICKGRDAKRALELKALV